MRLVAAVPMALSSGSPPTFQERSSNVAATRAGPSGPADRGTQRLAWALILGLLAVLFGSSEEDCSRELGPQQAQRSGVAGSSDIAPGFSVHF